MKWNDYNRTWRHTAKSVRLSAKHGNLHMVPTTGAGPHASVLGNACERGYGITPDTDHLIYLRNGSPAQMAILSTQDSPTTVQIY